jgi:flavin reductase (DIM6/NTAB) family NADH-FMN oxidoreductase RutF
MIRPEVSGFEEAKKMALRKMTYGMWVLTAGKGDDLESSSVTWVMQTSFNPPLVVAAVEVDSHLAQVIERHQAFAIHLLTKQQKALAEAFTKPTKVGGGKIGGIAFKPAPVTGAPLLEGFSAWVGAKVTDVVRHGDHSLFVAQVVEAGVSDDKAKPLVLAEVGWNYGG